eukprot:NODE_1703_length_906_cov_355.152859_g1186_i0.p1 GENE.NODE_1703_length_906_cov_355.152859_g1186_i0~~NODE_1703_length_906_cov_355.152859_g1186_i0.p1  ORF type:complete len:244 (+),score=19.13 NODE_1703_length_906_cov_355.152859_g1186_i0:33-764(+)
MGISWCMQLINVMSGEISSVLWNDGPPPGARRDDMQFFNSNYAQPGDSSYSNPQPNAGHTGGFSVDEFERPLLEELGIDFQHIKRKAWIVCNPFKPCMDAAMLQDGDLAGPLLFSILLGCALLLSGRVHFGYIFGMGLGGCVCLYALLNVMTDKAVDLQYTVSTLGYCLVPTLMLGGFSTITFLNLNFLPWFLSYPIGCLPIAWSSWCATKMFVDGLGMLEQRWLILYPITLLYATFAVISIF